MGRLIAPERRVVVMLSGGRDSTCLLDVAVQIAGSAHVSALHVNYGLREEADGDQRHCAELCEQLRVTLNVQRPRRPGSGNLQAWARDARYGAAAVVAHRLGADVAAGHTASDQAETILYRLASAPSRRALLGMPAREGLLVRPLLGFTREQTADYCRERGLRWREDVTNEGGAFARGRVRHGLLAAMRTVHPGAERNLVAVAGLLRQEAAVLDELVEDVLAGCDHISLVRLRGLPQALQGLVVQRLADLATGGLVPGAAARAGELSGLSVRGSSSLDIGSGVRAIVEYGVLRFDAVGDRPPAQLDPVRLPIPGAVRFGGVDVRCDLGPPAREPGVLDRAKLAPELVVRSWHPGDRIAPLGLRGTKSLQDLFTARRVPRERRRSIAVVQSAGEIAWIPGVATSERFKVTDTTVEAVHLAAGRE